MNVRRVASAILGAAVRRTTSERREWADAMLREMDFIESDWSALRWAIGGTVAILRPIDLPMRDLSEVPARFEGLQKTIRRNQFVGYATCLFLIAVFSRNIFLFLNPLQRVGSILTVVGSGFMAFQIYLSHSHTKVPALTSGSASVLATVNRYRAALQKLRDFHYGIWLWSRLIIFLPGPLLFLLGSRIANPALARIILNEAAVFLALGVFAIPLNLWMSRKYDRKSNN